MVLPRGLTILKDELISGCAYEVIFFPLNSPYLDPHKSEKMWENGMFSKIIINTKTEISPFPLAFYSS